MAEQKRAHRKPAGDFTLNWCGFLPHPHVRVDGALINQSNQKEPWESLRRKSHRERKRTASKCSSPRQVYFPVFFQFFWPRFKCFFPPKRLKLCKSTTLLKVEWLSCEFSADCPSFYFTVSNYESSRRPFWKKMSKWGNCWHLLDLRCVTFYFPLELIENILEKKLSVDLLQAWR